ncbi:MAG: type II toxin-antitoxin system VapC family toxin [Pyrinomonadaceae bacterium]
MKVLVDTHVLLWSLIEPHRLSGEATDLLLDPKVERFFSAASCWEIGIKFALGKLDLPALPSECVPIAMREADLNPLPIRMAETFLISEMPHRHGDPFDRLLAAQAKHNNMYLMSHDSIFASFDVDWIEI